LFWLRNVGLGQISQVVGMKSRKLNPKKNVPIFFLKGGGGGGGVGGRMKKSPQQREKYFRLYYKEKNSYSCYYSHTEIVENFPQKNIPPQKKFSPESKHSGTITDHYVSKLDINVCSCTYLRVSSFRFSNFS
jgi:hypothetical protein